MLSDRAAPWLLRVSTGDHLYVFVRWLMLLLIFVGSTFLHNTADSTSPSARIIWIAAGYALLASIAAFMPQTRPFLPWLYAVDLLLIAVVGLVVPGSFTSYTPWLLVPLVAAALQVRRVYLLVLSTLAIIVSSFLLVKAGGSPDLFSFTSHAAMYAFLPLLFHVLVEQRSLQDQERLKQAEQKMAQITAHAAGARDRMHALYEAAVSLHTVEHATNILETMLTECARLLPYSCGVVLLSTGTTDEVSVVASRNVQPSETVARLKVGTGILGVVLRGGPGGVVCRPHEEHELVNLPSLRNCTAMLLVPLRSANKTYGLVLFGSDQPEFTLEQMEMVTLLTGYALVALQNTHLIADLKAEQESLLAREEEVRKQLNRDLHDGPAQALVAISMSIDHIKRLLQVEPDRALDELDQLKQRAQRANHEVRTLLFELRPLVLETQGLISALEQYVERFQNTDGPRIILRADTSIPLLSKRTQSAVFGVVQEAVNNAIKHAHAQNIWIRLSEQAGEISLVVQDDGRGFDVAAVQSSYDQRGSFGLLSLHERTQIVGGETELVSAPGQGTTIRVKVPVS